MSYIKGKFKEIIYENSDNNYLVSLFKVEETNEESLLNAKDKTINVTGTISNVKLNMPYILNGNYVKHPKYSWQFSFNSYESVKPSDIDTIMEFLASPFIKGCGKETAKKIVKIYGLDSINKIKEDYNNLFVIKGMTPLKAMKIYSSVLEYEKDDEIIIHFTKMGFSLEDASKILSKHNDDIEAILEGNLYLLKNIFDFKKIDEIYINNYDKESTLRCKECILNSMMQISFNEGSTFYTKEEIYRALTVLFSLNISSDKFDEILEILINEKEIIKKNNNYYLKKYYDEEKKVAKFLEDIINKKPKKITKFDEKLEKIEKENNITYNEEQKKAIKEALSNNVSIISGGPGTGKTTIIKAIVSLYKKENNLDNYEVRSKIALLAPTGRASKKLSMATNLPAYTIHRFLKWHKETDTFEYDEKNHISEEFIIVDETSMIDISLAKSLLAALPVYAKIVFVGDVYQLPSVGPGLVLQDLIQSDLFAFTHLSVIYRQSDNSYIPYLAKDIKMQNIDDEFMYKRDDYNFIPCSDEEIVPLIIKSVKYALNKGLNEDNIQVLAPMYKGINGIDNLNKYLQEVYNKSGKKNEIKYGDKIFRENDKVLQTVNDSDNNVFNGDIGKILCIYKNSDNKIEIQIDFDGNVVYYEKKDLKNITHAYAITIHKSQGSEFDHVIMPVCKSYYIMLYNKLLYTGVSRAKKSLTIIGDPRSFISGISNNYASTRKTSLIDNLNKITFK